MHRCLPICFLLLSFAAQAQLPDNDSKWGVSLSPGLILTPNTRYAVQPGVEYRIIDRLYILGEFPIPVGRATNDSAEKFTDKKYFRLKAELRYIVESRERIYGNFNKYIGLQVTYSLRRFKDMDGGFYYLHNSRDSAGIAFDRAAIRSPIFTASFQVGGMVTLSSHLYTDGYIGLGVRTIFTRYDHVVNGRFEIHSRFNRDNQFVLDQAYKTNRTVTRFHGNIGARLVYRF